MTTPFMQLWVADYLGDTKHLTTEQHGAYLLLLMTMWRADGALPADDTKLARIVGLTVVRWNKIKGDIMAMLTIENGLVSQKRLWAELKKAREKSEKRAEAGRKGGTAKALNGQDTGQANATVLLKHSSEPEPKPEVAATAQETSNHINRLNRVLGFSESDWEANAANIRALVGLKAEGLDFENHILPAAEACAGRAKSVAYLGPKAREIRDAKASVAALPPPFEPASDKDWARRLAVFRDKGVWSPKWGPKPDEPGCKCPAEILNAKEAA